MTVWSTGNRIREISFKRRDFLFTVFGRFLISGGRRFEMLQRGALNEGSNLSSQAADRRHARGEMVLLSVSWFSKMRTALSGRSWECNMRVVRY